jgi:hypothetical protein
VLIDTSIVSQANSYLVKGANARVKLHRLEKLVKADSMVINYQDSVINRQTKTIDSISYDLQNSKNTILLQRDVIKGIGGWAILMTLMAIFL